MNRKLFSAGRKLLSVVLCMALLATVVLAGTWDLKNGQISVNANEDGQMVTQYQQDKTVTEKDAAPVITGVYEGPQSDTDQGAAITMNSTGNATAKITLDNAYIYTNSTGIDVKGSSNAEINVQNTKDRNTGDVSGTMDTGVTIIQADDTAIHVTDGNLTIRGGTEGTYADNSVTNDGEMAMDLFVDSHEGSAIGSSSGEDMSGSITIKDDVTLAALSEYGSAAIGSGSAEESKRSLPKTTEMSGSITVTDKADVLVSHEGGAGLGSGMGSNMSGSIQITGNAAVTEGNDCHVGATIGSGFEKNYPVYESVNVDAAETASGFTGQITIGKNTNIDFLNVASKKALFPEEETNVTIGNAPKYSFDAMSVGPRGNKKEATQDILADGTKGSITIERGATIEKTTIQSHQDADPYLNCYVETGKDDPVTMDHVNVYIVDGSRPSQPVQAEAQIGTHYYWVTANGISVPYTVRQEGDVLHVTTEEAAAEFHCSVYGLNLLIQEGINSVVFHTASLESGFRTAEAAEGRSGSAYLVLSHQESSSSMTIGGEDASDLLS